MQSSQMREPERGRSSAETEKPLQTETSIPNTLDREASLSDAAMSSLRELTGRLEPELAREILERIADNARGSRFAIEEFSKERELGAELKELRKQVRGGVQHNNLFKENLSENELQIVLKFEKDIKEIDRGLEQMALESAKRGFDYIQGVEIDVPLRLLQFEEYRTNKAGLAFLSVNLLPVAGSLLWLGLRSEGFGFTRIRVPVIESTNHPDLRRLFGRAEALGIEPELVLRQHSEDRIRFKFKND